MEQSQDIGNVRLELIVTALGAVSTKTRCRPNKVKGSRLRAEPPAEEPARIQVRRKPDKSVPFERSTELAVT